MKILYISKSYNYIYRNAGIASILVDNGKEEKVFQSRYFNISELNAELRALVDTIEEMDDSDLENTCIIFPAGKIRKIGIDNILRSVGKGDDDDIRSLFKKNYERISSCTIVMTDNKDSGHKEWFKIANKIARFSLENVNDGLKLVDIIRRYPTLSFNEMMRRIKIKSDKESIEKEIRRREEIKTRRSGRYIYVVTMTNGTFSGIDFATYDEGFANDYVKKKDKWFAKNTRAIENYSFCMKKSGCMNPSSINEERLKGTGISLEKFKEIDRETIHGRYNKWSVEKVKIRKEE